jgi:hypothetical protein
MGTLANRDCMFWWYCVYAVCDRLSGGTSFDRSSMVMKFDSAGGMTSVHKEGSSVTKQTNRSEDDYQVSEITLGKFNELRTFLHLSITKLLRPLGHLPIFIRFRFLV